jgi:TatD DNase family protein
MVDTHCHLDLYDDVAATIRRVEASGVFTVAVTNTPSVYEHLITLVGSAKRIRVAIGLHPELAHERDGELPLFRQFLEKTRYVGEVGLDYVTTDQERRQRQRRALTRIVQWCAEEGGKVVTVHSRRAAEDVVDMFGAFAGTYILHWYSGSARALDRALANGAYVSVNPMMLLSQRSLAVIKRVPKERMLTETDGPFVKVDKRPAEPPDVRRSIGGLATLWGMELDAAGEVVYENFARILGEDGMML